MMKAKAAVMVEFSKPLVIREFDIPRLEDSDILVKIEAAGVCGSDVHYMWSGRDSRTPLPLIIGHEGIGCIAQIKSEKRDIEGKKLREGDLIIWNRGVSCGHCYFCSIKRTPSLCPNRWVYGITRSCEEYPFLNGCYSEYLVLRENTDIIRIDEDIDPAIMVAASCSGATAAHCYDLASPELGDTVLIQGPGPLGLFAVAFARNLGARNVILIGGTESRLELGGELGATHLLNRKSTTQNERRGMIMDITNGRGVDLAIEAVGLPQAVAEGIKLVRTGATYLSVGFGAPAGRVELDCFADIVRKNLDIKVFG
jgi:threonine dehydrogenase-like Zn-dependent dehydrogenase